MSIRIYPEWVHQGAAAGPKSTHSVLDIGNELLEVQKSRLVLQGWFCTESPWTPLSPLLLSVTFFESSVGTGML